MPNVAEHQRKQLPLNPLYNYRYYFDIKIITWLSFKISQLSLIKNNNKVVWIKKSFRDFISSYLFFLKTFSLIKPQTIFHFDLFLITVNRNFSKSETRTMILLRKHFTFCDVDIDVTKTTPTITSLINHILLNKAVIRDVRKNRRTAYSENFPILRTKLLFK